jgi:chromosome segregation ATPase
MTRMETPVRSFDDAVSDLLKQAAASEQTRALRDAEARAARAVKYVAMIREQDPGLASDILELAGELGISPDQVKRDADTIRRALEFEPVAKARDARLQRLNEVNEEFKALHLRHTDERAAMKRLQAEAEFSYDTATNAERELHKLRQSHPELFTS